MTNLLSAEQRSEEREAVRTLLQNFSAHLRPIKDMEMAWVTRYTVLAMGILWFLVTRDPSPGYHSAQKPLSLLFLFVIAFAGLVATGLIQWQLLCERKSYYLVLRVVMRAQNYLGLIQTDEHPERMLSRALANSVFPEGLGPGAEDEKGKPPRDKDGTQRWASFGVRQVYTFLVYISLLVTMNYYHQFPLWGFVVLVVVDFGWLVVVFGWDYDILYYGASQEQELAGVVDRSWYEGDDDHPINRAWWLLASRLIRLAFGVAYIALRDFLRSCVDEET